MFLQNFGNLKNRGSLFPSTGNADTSNVTYGKACSWPAAGCRFSSKDTCTFTLILQRAKVSKYHQNIKISFSTKNIKMSAVSTPIFARISPFFCIFRDLPEYIGENASKCQKMQKSFAPNFGNFQKISKKRSYFDTLAGFCTSVLCWMFAFSFWNLWKSAASICTACP